MKFLRKDSAVCWEVTKKKTNNIRLIINENTPSKGNKFMLTRRALFKLSAGTAISTVLPKNLFATEKNQRVVPDYEKPMFDLPAKIKEPVIIELGCGARKKEGRIRPIALPVNRRSNWSYPDQTNRALYSHLRKARCSAFHRQGCSSD